MKVKWTGRHTVSKPGIGDFAPDQEREVSEEQAAIIRAGNDPEFVFVESPKKGKEK